MKRKEWDALGNPPGSFDAVLDMAERNAQAKYVPLDQHEGGPTCIDCDEPFQHLARLSQQKEPSGE